MPTQGLLEVPPGTCSWGFLNPGCTHTHRHTHTHTEPKVHDSLNGEISPVLIFLFFPLSQHLSTRNGDGWALPELAHPGLSGQREPSPPPTPHLLWVDTYMQLPRRQVHVHTCNTARFVLCLGRIPGKCKTVVVRASLVAQWLRICLPMQGTRVRALVWEDPTCRGATGPVSHNY